MSTLLQTLPSDAMRIVEAAAASGLTAGTPFADAADRAGFDQRVEVNDGAPIGLIE